MPAIQKEVIACGQRIVIACDGNCAKAWGIQHRPKVQLSDNEDDFAYVPDQELGDAPIDPGTYEGGHGKPMCPEMRLNKWCFRECERCQSAPEGKRFKLPNFFQPVYNMHWRAALQAKQLYGDQTQSPIT